MECGGGVRIEINMDRKCPECSKGGATQNGLCLGCIVKSMRGLPMKSDLGRAHQKQIGATVKRVVRT